MITVARTNGRVGYRYQIMGEISKNAIWSQTLDFPSDGSTLTLTGLDVQITFRNLRTDDSAILTLSTTDGQITVTDADTLTILASVDDLSGLDTFPYVVDIATQSGSSVTHLAHGEQIMVRNNPSPWT
jgi:hypothetical protein